MPRQRWPGIALPLVLGAGLVAGCGGDNGVPEQGIDPFLDTTIVATVGNYTIRAYDLDARLRNQFPDLYDRVGVTTEESIRNIIALDVNRLCYVSEAERTGFDKTNQDFLQALESTRRVTLQRSFFDQMVVKATEPTDAELRRYWRENPDEFRLPERAVAYHIPFDNREDAQEALEAIRGGKSFRDVADELSEARGHRVGKSLGLVQRGKTLHGIGSAAETVKAILAMEEGEVGIVESPKGLHVVWVERKYPESIRPFEDIREALASRIWNARQQTRADSLLKALQVRYQARIVDENLAAYLAWRRAGPEEELWKLAQAETDPVKRIGIYEDYLKRFSYSEHAAEAQFMIGFIYAEELKDRHRAREVLNEFIKTYPQSELAASARFMLDELSSVKRRR